MPTTWSSYKRPPWIPTGSTGNDRVVDSDLIELAAAHGVATSYRNGERKVVEVDEDVVVRILGLLDVDAAEPESRTAALALAREKAALGALPGTIAHRTGTVRPLPGPGVLIDAEGTRTDVTELPDDLGPGCYRLELVDEQLGRDVTVVVAPAALPETPRAWGWMLQLYALHSPRSWGIGDLGDLREFVGWTGREHGAEAVLLNPLHAITPGAAGAGVALHAVEQAVRDGAGAARHRPRRLPHRRRRHARPGGRAASRTTAGDRIEHDRVWAAKRSACELLWHSAGRPEPIGAPDDLWRVRDLLRVRRALREPVEPVARRAAAPRGAGRRPRARRAGPAGGVPRVAAGPGAASAVRSRAAWHGRSGCGSCTTSPSAATRRAPTAGPCRTSSRWACTSVPRRTRSASRARTGGCRRGAPTGWTPPATPPTATCCGPSCGHADGLRIDHVAGLWRLWWVPPGESPDRGTYVHYDSDVMLAVLTLEAWRAGAVVIGEDLGTVEPEVTEGLAERNILGSSVLWFTRDIDSPRLPAAAAGPVEPGVGRDGLDPRPPHGVGLPARRARARPGRARPARRSGRREGARRARPPGAGRSCCARRVSCRAPIRARTS